MRHGNGHRSKHQVTLCRWAAPRRGRSRPGRGGRLQLFAFSWRDLAQLLDLKVRTVQKLAKAGALDPTDLESIVVQWTKRAKRRARMGLSAPAHTPPDPDVIVN